MKSISTTYHGPTNRRGSRIIADDGDGNRVIKGYDHALNVDGNHAAACRALVEKMGWKGRLVGGWAKRGMAWCFDPKHQDNSTVTTDW